MDHRAVGQRGERFESQIDARLLSGRLARAAQAHRHRRSRHTSHPLLGEMVTVLGVPSSGRLQRTATRPILDEHQKAVIQPRAVAKLLVGETVEAVRP